MTKTTPKSLLYIGAKSGTSRQRAEALRRLGHEVTHISPYLDLLPLWAAWLSRTGGVGIDAFVSRSLRRQIAERTFDCAHVDSGDVIGPLALQTIRCYAPKVSNYNADNPYHTPPLERRRWDLFRRSASGYDLNVTVKRENIEQQMRAIGVANPLTIWQCADEANHFPLNKDHEGIVPTICDVIFVGTWMPGRDGFMIELIRRGLNVSIYGPRWERAPNLSGLGNRVTNRFLSGLEYRNAIVRAKIALVLLNENNYDLHTTRTAEIPAMGVVMCAPRTSHHLALYNDEKEALLFDNATDCAEKCLRLLTDESRRGAIAQAGYERTFQNKTYNENLMKNIMRALIYGLTDSNNNVSEDSMTPC